MKKQKYKIASRKFTNLSGSCFMKLICADCVDYMKEEIFSDSIDLVVTSPPYDFMRGYQNSEIFAFEKFMFVAQELYRVVKIGGVVVWVVGDSVVNGFKTGTSFRQALYFQKIGFGIHDVMFYQKTGVVYPAKTRYHNVIEYMFVLSKGKPKTFNPIRDRKNKYAGTPRHGTDRKVDGTLYKTHNIGKIITEYGIRYNTWTYASGRGASTNDNIAFEHPAIFPEKLAKDHVISWSNKGDLVLDPFMGSNTVGKICRMLCRDFIGIEKVSDYFSISKKRIGIK